MIFCLLEQNLRFLKAGIFVSLLRVVTLAERTAPNLGTSQDLGKLGFVLGSLLVCKVKAA